MRIKTRVVLFIKGYVQAHTRKLASGAITTVRGHTRISASEKKRLHEFVSGVLADKTNNSKSIVLHVSSSHKREKVLNETGIDIGNPREILVASRVIHSHNDHPRMTVEDWDALPSLMESFDRAYTGRADGDPKTRRIIFAKIEKRTGLVYVAELARSKNKGDRLNVVSFFKDNPRTVAAWLSDRVESEKG